MHKLADYNDEQLIELLKGGSQPSFSEIYERYWEPLFISAEKILQNRAGAQDCVQEVFISLWNRRLVVEIESLSGWLFQATRFQVFKAIRSENTGHDFFRRLITVSNEITREDPVLFRELQQVLEKLISGLPADQREMFTLNRNEGLTYREIAGLKNISVKTVEKKMSRALRHIRQHLDDGLLFALLLHFLR
ncbi:MAG TPA: sigma-70 family RNA polymerase sigma factor [Mucilaginibacter sp.]